VALKMGERYCQRTNFHETRAYSKICIRARSTNLMKIMKKNPSRCKNVSKFIIPYLCEGQHVSGDIPSIIRSLKLHWQLLVFHT
jgi:hypothetical protein